MNNIIVLDFDGVITRLDIDWNHVIRETSRVIGFEIQSLHSFFESYYGSPLYEAAHEFVKDYEIRAVCESKLFPDVELALGLIKGRAYLTSMQANEALRLFITRNRLGKYFKKILGRDKFGSKRRQLEYIVQEIGFDGRSLIRYVDDLERNCRMAEELGLKAIHLRRGENNELYKIVKLIFESE